VVSVQRFTLGGIPLTATTTLTTNGAVVNSPVGGGGTPPAGCTGASFTSITNIHDSGTAAVYAWRDDEISNGGSGNSWCWNGVGQVTWVSPFYQQREWALWGWCWDATDKSSGMPSDKVWMEFWKNAKLENSYPWGCGWSGSAPSVTSSTCSRAAPSTRARHDMNVYPPFHPIGVLVYGIAFGMIARGVRGVVRWVRVRK
jgi:hypothetical protein